jgi:hypothetical protein
MPDMPTRSDESPPRQEDRSHEPARASRDEVSNFETDVIETSGNDDTGAPWTDDESINTHGSER